MHTKFKSQELLGQVRPGKVLVAVSGGADSVILLHLLRRLAAEKKWNLYAVHVQHHLRGKESLRDQRFVESLCRKWGIPLDVRSIRLGNKKSEEAARTLRYRALARSAGACGAKTLLAAHNANDQAETFLLNLLRGTGTAGLAGILPSRPLSEVTGKAADSRVRLLRPLLTFSRREILGYARAQGLDFREDSTNRDRKYRRNWVRHELIPLAEKAQPRLTARLGELASIFRAERDYLDSRTAEMKRRLFRRGKLDLSGFFRYHKGLRFRFLHSLWPRSSYGEIARIHAFLGQRKKSLRKSSPWIEVASQPYRFLKGSRAPEGKSRRDFSFRVPGEKFSKEWNLKIRSELVGRKPVPQARALKAAAAARKALFDADKVNSPLWTIRTWKPGDRFRPFGMAGTKKVQDFFTDAKVPREERSAVPILEAGGKIRWIVGFRTDEDSRIGPGTRRVVQVRID